MFLLSQDEVIFFICNNENVNEDLLTLYFLSSNSIFLGLNGFGLLPGEVISSRAKLFSVVSLDCFDIDESRIPTLSSHCILYEYKTTRNIGWFGLQENLIGCVFVA